ncbi:MAG: 30S ribosomal protein S20 [bacterium]
MDRHQSTIKRHRQSLVARQRNRAAKSAIRTASKDLLESLGKPEAQEKLKTVSSLLDRASRRSLMHRCTADRRKSRFAKKVAQAAASSES